MTVAQLVALSRAETAAATPKPEEGQVGDLIAMAAMERR